MVWRKEELSGRIGVHLKSINVSIIFIFFVSLMVSGLLGSWALEQRFVPCQSANILSRSRVSS